MTKNEILEKLSDIHAEYKDSDYYDAQEALEIAMDIVKEKLSLLGKVYVVVEKPTATPDTSVIGVFVDKAKAEKCIAEITAQDQSDWAFDNGTIYEGDGYLETEIMIKESEVEL